MFITAKSKHLLQSTKALLELKRRKKSNYSQFNSHNITVLIGINHLSISDLCIMEVAEYWSVIHPVCRYNCFGLTSVGICKTEVTKIREQDSDLS